MKEWLTSLILAAVALLLTSPVLCGLIVLSGNTASVKSQMKSLFPEGSSIYNAEKTMTDEGFTCSYMDNKDFAETDGRDEPVIHRNISFLYCTLERSRGIFSFSSERWQAAIVHKGVRVKDIYVSYGLTGP